MADQAPHAETRIDRWLLAARLFKTRAIAQAACSGGKVEINCAGASPHRLVRPGDRVRISTPRGPRELVVQAIAERRLPAPDAAALYEDLTPAPPPSPRRSPFDDAPLPPPPGRPSKRDRRMINRLRGR